MKKITNDTPASALTAVNCTTHSVEVTFNMDLTVMFWPHPDIHEEILKEAEVDMDNAVQVESALRDYANESVEGSALGLTAWKHVADGTGVVTYYANSAIRPRQNINNPKATHYARPVVGGVATDPAVKEAREFFNNGLPDLQAGTVTGRAVYYGSASATTFSYAKTQANRPKGARKSKNK